MMRWVMALGAVVFVGGAAVAADPTYWGEVRPILRKHCTVCHSERKLNEPELSAGLALDKPELILKGSKSGPVLVVGKPESSLLVTLLTTKDKKRGMPLDADPLPEAEIAIIRKWVAAGAIEGVKPKEDNTVAIASPGRPLRKLPVSFSTKAALPKSANLPGALEVTLPVGPLPPVAAAAFSPDGKLLAMGSYGRVTVWDLAAARPAKVLTNVLGAVNALRFSPDGKQLAVGGGQPSIRGDLRLFDTSDWKLVHALGGHLDTVAAVAFSPDGTRLASASFDKTVRLWEVKTGKLSLSYTGHSDAVYGVAFSPDGVWFATASKDRTGRIVDAATGKGQVTLSGMDQEVMAVAIRPDGMQVVTSGLDAQLSWWDPKTAERLKRTAGPGMAVHELTFDPKGMLCAAAGGDGSVRLCKPQTGDALKVLSVGSPVFTVAVDPIGKRVASGSADGLMRLWDSADGRLISTLWSGDSGWLAITPEGYYCGTEELLGQAAWKVAGKPVTDARLLAPFRSPSLVGKALDGQKVTGPGG